MERLFEQAAFIAAVVLPLWNIPLIVKMVRRRSSRDISVAWAAGVWICILVMAPSGFKSPDPVWRIFNIMNVIFFTLVFLCVVIYRKGPNKGGDHGA